VSKRRFWAVILSVETQRTTTNSGPGIREKVGLRTADSGRRGHATEQFSEKGRGALPVTPILSPEPPTLPPVRKTELPSLQNKRLAWDYRNESY